MDIKIKDILKEVDKRRDEIIAWTKKLITYPSENRPPNGFEADLQKFIERECKNLGLEVDTFAPDSIKEAKNHPWWLSGRNYSNNRNNVVGLWKGNSKGKSLLFSGHADVAPFEPGEWKVTKPFSPKIVDGRLYGRGSSDLKGGMSAAFWAIKILKDMGFTPRGDIIFESVVDEEFAGGNGTLASRLKGYNTDLAVLVEPTRMEICSACLGAFLGEIKLKGNAGMPYMGFDIPNPIYGMSSLIEIFKKWAKKWVENNSHPLFQDKGKELKVLLWDINSKSEEEFTQMGTPLVSKLSWIIWCYPGIDEKKFKKDFRDFWEKQAKENNNLKPFSIEHKFTYHYVRPWKTNCDNKAVKEIIDTYTDYTGNKSVVTGAPFSCDMAIYGDIGNMPIIILGPRGQNLHAPDEWVLIEDIIKLTGIFVTLAIRWSG